jgi:aminopeptidase
VSDPRVAKLAELLVGYSVDVKPGERVLIRGDSNAEPLLVEIYAKVLQAGGHPVLYLGFSRQDEIFYKYASDSQLDFVPDPLRLMLETYDVYMRILSPANTKALSEVDPLRVQRRQKALGPTLQTIMGRSARGSLRWTLAPYPTSALAQDAEMSLTDYEEFVFRACMPDLRDPIGYWKGVSAKQARIIDWLGGKREIRVAGPETDLSLSISGRTFINCDCHVNVPDGEVFTGPVEDSVEGQVHFSFPAIYQGREVEGVRLWFEKGRVVRATAKKNGDFLQRILDTDEGSRRVGEFSIGTNEGITRFTREILFDEKIGGSFHMALGASYPESGGTNQSAIHWDMICDLRQGGRITVDGQLLHENGQFVI